MQYFIIALPNTFQAMLFSELIKPSSRSMPIVLSGEYTGAKAILLILSQEGRHVRGTDASLNLRHAL